MKEVLCRKAVVHSMWTWVSKYSDAKHSTNS